MWGISQTVWLVFALPVGLVFDWVGLAVHQLGETSKKHLEICVEQQRYCWVLLLPFGCCRDCARKDYSSTLRELLQHHRVVQRWCQLWTDWKYASRIERESCDYQWWYARHIWLRARWTFVWAGNSGNQCQVEKWGLCGWWGRVDVLGTERLSLPLRLLLLFDHLLIVISV